MRLWMLLLLVGCDQILGLGKVGPPVDGVPDAPGPIRAITGRISQLFVHADATTSPALENRGYPPNAISLAYVTDAGSTNLAIDSAGNFTFMAPAGTYRLALTGQGDPVGRDFVLSSDTLDIQTDAILSRPDALPVAGATIVANFSLASPVLFSTGIWETQVPMFSNGVSFTAMWPYQRLEAAKGDLVYAVEYENTPSLNPTANYINAVAKGAVTLMDGQQASIAGPLVRYDGVSPGHQCLSIAPQFDVAFMRLAAVGIPSDAQGHEWSVNAFPSDKIMPVTNGMPIAFDQVTYGSNALIEDAFGLPMLAISAAAVGHMYGVTNLTSAITEWHEVKAPPNGCPTETFDTIEAPVATSPILAGQALDGDDVMVDRNGKLSIDLTWGPARFGTGWEIELDEVGMQADPLRIHTILTDQTRVTVESSLLVPGRAYVFRISSLAGLTSVAHGDFESATFPFASTSVVSHVFNVK